MKSLRELIETITETMNEAAGELVAGDPDRGKLPDAIDASLQGTIDVKALAGMLPDVTDATKFGTALQKVRLGRLERLTRWEKEQLCGAFISLMRADSNATTAAMQKLRAIHSK